MLGVVVVETGIRFLLSGRLQGRRVAGPGSEAGLGVHIAIIRGRFVVFVAGTIAACFYRYIFGVDDNNAEDDFTQEQRRPRTGRLGRVCYKDNRVTSIKGAQEEELPRPAYSRKISNRRKLIRIRCKFGFKRRRRRWQKAVYPEPAHPVHVNNHFSNTAESYSEAREASEASEGGLRVSPTRELMLSNETLNVGWCNLHGDYAFALKISEGGINED